MTLRTRLLLSFLALALVPTALLTGFTLDRLGRAMDLWNAPGVERALESALETSKTSLARMEATVQAQAQDWASALPPEPLTEQRRTAIRAGLRASGVDFMQLYERDGETWRLLEEVRPEGVLGIAPLDLGEDLAAGLPDDIVIRSPAGVLAAAAPIGTTHALAAGMHLSPDFFDAIERVGQGVDFYDRLGIVRDVSRAYMWLLVGVLVALLALAALWAATVLAASMTEPLRRIGSALERVSAGDLDVRIEPGGPAEVEALSRRFNLMTERLGAARTALQEAEREAAWREVARRLAHEFKNLLTPMSLSLHRLRRRSGAVPDQHRAAVQESLDALSSGVDQLTRLTEQFSQYARLPEPRYEPVDLHELVRSAVRLHEHEDVRVRVEPAGSAPLWVRGDGLLLSRAVHNLVLNACEASTGGGEVEVHTLAENGCAVVEVLDRGPGLAPEVRERLFEPYVSTKRRGSGLGLSLVRDVASQHQGGVTLENRDGGGARARLVLPLLSEPHSDPAGGTDA